jgi:hypothetical protein
MLKTDLESVDIEIGAKNYALKSSLKITPV